MLPVFNLIGKILAGIKLFKRITLNNIALLQHWHDSLYQSLISIMGVVALHYQYLADKVWQLPQTQCQTPLSPPQTNSRVN